jgi:anti-sigma factor RsiW
MKDSEFIELINLYLDHEISAADSARLEAEVQANPARRRIYQDYCRMQKACKVLAQDFQTEAAPRDAKVIDFNSAARPARASGFYVGTALAAFAACVAVVFVLRERPGATPTETGRELAVQAAQAPAVVQQLQPTTVPVQAATAVAAVAPRLPSQPALVGTPLTLSTNSQAEALMVSAVEQANAQFDWMRRMTFVPVQQPVPMEELRFNARPATLKTEARTFHSPQSVETPTEMVVFRFTR